jgi:predicted O-linked N-acetylglucosamine transferase (SPINDLY family)
MTATPLVDSRVRVGIVSGQIRNHSVWNAFLKGWLKHLDRERVSLHVFHTGTEEDAETESARANVSRFVQGPKSFREWVGAIVDEQLDVLIYPEIGMEPTTFKLASLRLAPIQAVSWGHPETSGLPTIDYYLSAQDFEPEAAQDNYRERLVSLPHLGTYFDTSAISYVDLDLAEFGVDTDVPILLCPGAPFKYQPQHDWMLVEIARRLKHCQLLFFHHVRENLSAKLEERLESAFDKAGLFFHAHGVFLPWLKPEAFHAVMRKADVFLDTVGFSGFNTAMQAIECCLPVVTKDGRFMRGRLASGILKRMGLNELIANTDEQYVQIAVNLASDKDYALRIRERIAKDRSVLFRDMVPIRSLEKFLTDVTRK